MAALTITAANVGVHANTTVKVVQAAEAITQGESVYKNGSKYNLTDNNSSVAKTAADGIAITAAGVDGYFVVATRGDVDLGATLSIGESYIVGTVDGTIEPIGDLVSTEYLTVLGIATAADVLDLNINASGIQKA